MWHIDVVIFNSVITSIHYNNENKMIVIPTTDLNI